jgi:hypothetical protein
LTDGRPTGAEAEQVVAAAFELKNEGVTIYALGLDPLPMDREMLLTIASGPSRYKDAGDGAGLAEIYLDITGTLGCP